MSEWTGYGAEILAAYVKSRLWRLSCKESSRDSQYRLIAGLERNASVHILSATSRNRSALLMQKCRASCYSPFLFVWELCEPTEGLFYRHPIGNALGLLTCSSASNSCLWFFWMCCFHVSLESKVRPKMVMSLTMKSSTLFRHMVEYSELLCLLKNLITLFLLASNWNPLDFDQLLRALH